MFKRGRRTSIFDSYAVQFNTDDNGGGGGGDGSDKTFTQSEVDAAIAKAVSSVETKLGSKNQQLLNDLKSTRESLKAWEGLDPENVRGMLSHFENNQDLKDIAEGKHEEVIKRRVEKSEATYKSQIKQLEDGFNSTTEKLTKAEERIADLLIAGGASQAFVANGGDPDAVEDMIARARGVWSIEDGEAVLRDKNGELVTGEKGPITMDEWIKSQVTKAPHLFLESRGGKPRGNRGNSGNDGDDLLSLAKTNPKLYAEKRRAQIAERRKNRSPLR